MGTWHQTGKTGESKAGQQSLVLVDWLLRVLGNSARKTATIGIVGSSVCIFIMMVAGVVDIVSAQIFRKPVLLAFEVVSISLVGAVWLALAQAQLGERHITISILHSKLSRRGRNIARLFSHILGLLLGLGVCQLAWTLAVRSIAIKEVVPSGIPIPITPARIALLIGAVMFTLIMLTQTVREFTEMVGGREKEQETPG